ncbi:MAG: DUF4276 family protein [Gemmatales bacterium]|nr:DUF4276 family protein [Gemmataceae bacterium]MCS7159190.1 DUF4276 family protein [Gemmatales bacterium]MDW8174390.1 DUF4276 family protein [Gemmatales bacterium]MDW8242709.1 DUF4276 family protein [Thermogemmata sp.]
MKRILILCEGQTEETFVTRLLKPHLNQFDKEPIPTILVTKKLKSGHEFQGGITSYTRVRRDVYHLLRDSNAVCITTMLDYYGLPADFPGKKTLSAQTPYDRVAHLELAFAQDIDNPRFRPYLMLHEFEALLFVQPAVIPEALGVSPAGVTFNNITQFNSPEEIDDGQQTHPAARIKQVLPSYRKALDGPRIVERIGLGQIRARCPHFHEWLSYLERL